MAQAPQGGHAHGSQRAFLVLNHGRYDGKMVRVRRVSETETHAKQQCRRIEHHQGSTPNRLAMQRSCICDAS